MLRMPLISAIAVAFAFAPGLAAEPMLATETRSGVTIAVPWYLQWQWLRANPDRAPYADAFGFRRARIGLELAREERWDFTAEWDFEAGTWTDVNLNVALPVGTLRLGQYLMPSGFEQSTSNRNSVLLERSMPSALALNRRIGIGWEWADERSSLAVAVYDRNIARSETAGGIAARATHAPIAGGGTVLHLGASAAHERSDGGVERFSSRPDIGLGSFRLADTGTLTGVDRVDRVGLEAAWQAGPLLAQGEVLRADIDRPQGAGTVHGWFVLGSWFVTGEAREYDAGHFEVPDVDGRFGHLELGLRYDVLDLDDGPIRGGEIRTRSVGFNWNIHPRVRLSANHVRVDSERRGISDDPDFIEVRVMTQF